MDAKPPTPCNIPPLDPNKSIDDEPGRLYHTKNKNAGLSPARNAGILPAL